MQSRLLPRHQVKGDTPENRRLGEQELARCKEMGIDTRQRLTLQHMVSDDDIIFSATGITDGDLLKGITRKGHIATSESLLIRGKTGLFAGSSQYIGWPRTSSPDCRLPGHNLVVTFAMP